MFDLGQFEPVSSFLEPIADPGTRADAGPLVCIRIAKSWQAIAAGCALQVTQPPAWAVSDPTQLGDLLLRAGEFLLLIATAEACPIVDRGTVSITITAGNATATQAVTFAATYASAPVVVVGCDDITLGATYSARSTTGFTAHLTAAVPVIVDTTAEVGWVAVL